MSLVLKLIYIQYSIKKMIVIERCIMHVKEANPFVVWRESIHRNLSDKLNLFIFIGQLTEKES